MAKHVLLAGERHRPEQGPAHVEVVGLVEADAAEARVGDDQGRRFPGARRVAVALHLNISNTIN